MTFVFIWCAMMYFLGTKDFLNIHYPGWPFWPRLGQANASWKDWLFVAFSPVTVPCKFVAILWMLLFNMPFSGK